MKLYFVRIQTNDDEFNVQIRASSKEQVETVIRSDYANIYTIDITDITWSEL